MDKISSLAPNKNLNDFIKTINSSPKIKGILGLVILSIAVISLAFSPIFTKLSEVELSPTATIFNRLWISSIIMACWQLIEAPRESIPTFVKKTNRSQYKQRGLLILASISATVSSLLWAISFTQTSVASSTILRSLTPLFISFGAWLILKQQFDRQFVAGLIVSICGGIFIGWDDFHLGTAHLVGDVMALFSAALHGVNILTVGYLRDRDCTTSRVLFWRCGFGTLIVLPVVWLTNTQFFPTSFQGWLFVIALAVVCQTFGQGLLIFSLKQFNSSFVGIFTLLKPIFTALLAWFIFQENLNLISTVAVVLILFGIYLAKSSSSQATTNS